MSDATVISETKWYDRKLLFRSSAAGLVFFGLLYVLAMRHKPPEGFVFERMPSISGIYKCCEAGGRYSKSWVGGTGINCSPFSYFEFLGTNRNDCGLKEQLNGLPVEVVRAVIPSAGSRDPLVVRITSNRKTFYEVDDRRIRERWIYASTSSAVTLAFILVVILHGAQLIYLNRNIKNILGETP